MSKETMFVEVQVLQRLIYRVEVEARDAGEAERVVNEIGFGFDPYDDKTALMEILDESIEKVKDVFQWRDSHGNLVE